MPTLITPRPFRPALSGNRVLIIGDSIAGQGVPYETATGTGVGALTWNGWMRAFLGDCLTVASEDGVGGDTTSDVLARVDTTAQKAGDLAIVIAGINDVTGDVPARVTIDNLRTICRRFWDEGKHVVLCNLTPSTSVNTSARQTAHETVNAWIASLPSRAPNLTTVDVYSRLGTAPDTPKSGVLYDATHLSETGAAQMGHAIAEAVRDLFPTQFTEWHGPDSASVVHGNPLFESSGSGWSTNDATVAYSASSEHEGNVATLTMSGATQDDPNLVYVENISGGRFASGDDIVVKADVEWDVTTAQADVGSLVPDVRVQARNADGSFDAYVYSLQQQGGFNVNTDNARFSGRGVFRTRAYTVGANVDRLYVRFGVQGVEDGTVTCHRFSVYKV